MPRKVMQNSARPVGEGEGTWHSESSLEAHEKRGVSDKDGRAALQVFTG